MQQWNWFGGDPRKRFTYYPLRNYIISRGDLQPLTFVTFVSLPEHQWKVFLGNSLELCRAMIVTLIKVIIMLSSIVTGHASLPSEHCSTWYNLFVRIYSKPLGFKKPTRPAKKCRITISEEEDALLKLPPRTFLVCKTRNKLITYTSGPSDPSCVTMPQDATTYEIPACR